MRSHKVSLLAILFALMLILRGTAGYLERSGNGWVPTMADALILTVGAVTFLSRRSNRKTLTSAGTALMVYVVVVLIGAIPTFFLNNGMALYGIRSLLLAPLTLLIFQLANFSSKDRELVRLSLLCVVLLNCVVATWQAAFGYSAIEIAAIEATGSTYLVGERMRLIGLQQSGQDLSVIVGAATMWGIYQILNNGFRGVGHFTLLVTAYSGAITLLVLQRSVILGVGLSLGSLFMLAVFSSDLARKRSKWIKRAFLVGVFAAITLVISSFIVPEQFDEAVSRLFSLGALTTDTSWQMRQASTLPVSLDLISKNPLGYGVGTTGSVAASFGDASPLSQFVLGGLWTDSGYLFMVIQVGLVGALAWLMFLLLWAKQGLLVREFAVPRWNALVVLSFLAGSMFSGSFWGLASTMVLVLMFTSLENSKRAPHN